MASQMTAENEPFRDRRPGEQHFSARQCFHSIGEPVFLLVADTEEELYRFRKTIVSV